MTLQSFKIWINSRHCLIHYRQKMRIVKASLKHRTAVFVVLEPEVVDRNGDIVGVEEITDAAHDFVLNLSEKAVNVDHKKNTDTPDAQFVESYILPADLEGEDPEGNEYTISAGSWMVGIKFSEVLWEELQKGKFT